MEINKNLSFHRCSKDEIVEVHQLAQIIWPPAFTEILSESQSEFMLDWMYNVPHLQNQFSNGHRFFLVKEGTENIGFVGLEPDCPEKGKLRIHKIYLSPTKKGLGIGQWMMKRIEEVARKMDLKYLHLNVNRYNKAIRFYEKSGFQILKSEDIDIGKGYFMNDYVMQKELN